MKLKLLATIFFAGLMAYAVAAKAGEGQMTQGDVPEGYSQQSNAQGGTGSISGEPVMSAQGGDQILDDGGNLRMAPDKQGSQHKQSNQKKGASPAQGLNSQESAPVQGVVDGSTPPPPPPPASARVPLEIPQDQMENLQKAYEAGLIPPEYKEDVEKALKADGAPSGKDAPAPASTPQGGVPAPTGG